MTSRKVIGWFIFSFPIIAVLIACGIATEWWVPFLMIGGIATISAFVVLGLYIVETSQ